MTQLVGTRRPLAASRSRLAPDVELGLVLAARAGNDVARDELVDAFMPLIGGVARRYRNSSSVDRAELMQDGVVGLLRALKRYDTAAGTAFWPYASWWVRQAMQQLIAELARPTVLSDRALRQLARLKDAHRKTVQTHGREPSVEELVAATGLGREQIEHLLAVERTPRGLEERSGGDETGIHTVGERLSDPEAEDDYERVDRRLEIEDLRHVRGGLSERERTVLRARFGLGGPQKTLREIGGGLHLSAERVRQIEEAALGKLRTAWGAASPAPGPG